MSRMLHAAAHLKGFATTLSAERRGVTAVVTGIALAGLMGFAGLAIDVAVWLNATRGMQAAADQAVWSAAVTAGTNGCSNQDSAKAQAKAVAGARGYVNGVNNTTVTVTCNGGSTYTVVISQQQPMWFAGLFMSTAPTASAYSMAELATKESDLCVLALDGTDVTQEVTGTDSNAAWVNGSTTVVLHCGLAVDSTNTAALGVGGSSQLTATDIYLAGDDQGSPSGSATLTTSPTANNILRNQPPVADPYRNRTFTAPNHCDFTNYSVSSNGTTTLNPGVYCGGLSLGSTQGGNHNTKIRLTGGQYYIVGGTLSMNANADVSNPDGNGVTFILTGNSGLCGTCGYATNPVTINGGANASLAAPTSGTFSGMLFFGDRSAPFGGTSSSNSSCGGQNNAQIQINGGSGFTVTGAMYFPNQSICYSGNSTTTGNGKCQQLIARTISWTGNSSLELQCSGTGITAVSVTTPQLVR